MAKSLFLLLIAGIFGVALNSSTMSATDFVSLVGLNPAKIVETVVLPESVVDGNNTGEANVAVETTSSSVGAPVAGVRYEPVYEETAQEISVYEVPAPSYRNYTVTVYSDQIVASGLSYYDVYKTSKLLYAHNSSNLFGNLPSLGWGEYFTVTEGGVARTYQVANIIVYEKNVERGLLQRNGQGSYMRSVMNAIDKDSGAHYDLAMMTCYGTSFGNGDASHRYVIFANAV